MDLNDNHNSMNSRDIDAYHLNRSLKTTINEFIGDYLKNLDFIEFKSNQSSYLVNNNHYPYPSDTFSRNKFEQLRIPLRKNERLIHDFYGMFRSEMNRFFISLYHNVINEKYSANDFESVNISNRKIKIENLLNQTSYNLNEYIEKEIFSYSQWEDVSVLYLGTDNNFIKMIPEKI